MTANRPATAATPGVASGTAKKRRRKLRKLRQPRVAPSTKRVKIDDEFNEDVFKYISPISLIESIDLKLKPERYPRFMFKNQKKANTWSCQLKFLKKKWVSDNKPGKQPAKIDVCKKAIMELYKDTPELCVDVRNEMLKLNDRETDTMVTLFKNNLPFIFPIIYPIMATMFSGNANEFSVSGHSSSGQNIEYFVENFHSLIHQRTSGKNFNPEGLRDYAINVDNNRHDSEFIKPFLLTKKYPYTKKN
ncbi:249_t:CDS:2 [Entrophospora sp. SA101]|nr:249_t:CDS:2 [Entrophospora sp. SA101]